MIVPPRWLRRVVCHPVQVIGGFAVLIVLCVGIGLALILELPSRRKRVTRILIMLAAAIAADLSVVFGAWRLWFRRRIGRSDPSTWRADHIDLIGSALHRVIGIAQRVMNIQLRIDIDPQTRAYDAGLLVLSRHAGIGDSPLIAYVLTHHLHREPRVLLKRFLLWDAAVDLMLTRLDAHFLPPHSVDMAERDRQLVEFARSIDADDDALLLFPEGRNWTPARWEAQLEGASDDDAGWMSAHPSVLPPRSGGLRRLLVARPGLPLVVVAHRGLESINSVRTIWQGVPLNNTVEVRLRAYPTPRDADIDGWLRDRWAEIDEWARRDQPATSPS